MKIPEHIKKAIQNQEIHILATSTKEAKPNIVYVKFLKVYNDEQILIANNKFFKTEKNIEENPRLSFVVLNENGKSYQIKGTTQIHTNDNVFEDTTAWVKEARPDLQPKSAVILNVEEIFSGAEKINS
ncbi:MAG: pyridoxamine 5'-phosphate oxidase family protein [Nanobdellota archaeon]